MRMQRLNSYLIRLLLILGSLVAMLPIYMAVVNSFKTQGEDVPVLYRTADDAALGELFGRI